MPTVVEQAFTQKISDNFQLQYSSYPEIDYEYASNPGLYVDITKTDHRFFDLIKRYIDLPEPDIYSEEELKELLSKVQTLEPITRKVILVSDLKPEKDKIFWGKTFIFYLSWIEGKWYLTMIDFALTDCSS